MRKNWKTRLLGSLASTAMLVTYLAAPFQGIPLLSQKVYADDELPSPSYGKEYSVQDILNEFQIFVKDDLEAQNHTVGAIAVGGNGTVGFFGDGSVTSSYINHILQLNGYNLGQYISDPDMHERIMEECRLYFNSIEGEGDNELNNAERYVGYQEGNPEQGTPIVYIPNNHCVKIAPDCNYIDFDAAFTAIEAWSSSRANASDAYVVTEDDLTMVYQEEFMGQKYDYAILNFPLGDQAIGHNIIIPEELSKKIKKINFIDPTEEGKPQNECKYKELATGGYTFTFDTDEPITLGFGSGSLNNDMVTMYYNGDLMTTTAFKNLEREGATTSGETNIAVGMNLVWNFPNAPEVNTFFQAGHIVAPNAHFSILNGNGEGNIIAKSAFTNAETHFYSYYSYTAQMPAYTMDVEKHQDSDDGPALEGATIGLYPTDGENVADQAAYTVKTGTKNPNVLGLNPGKYVLKETKSPDGYIISGKEYYIEVIELGNYKYLNMPVSDSATADTTYSGGVLVRVYEDPGFTKLIEESEYSPLSFAENKYSVGKKTFEFDVDDSGNVTKVYEIADNGNRTDVTESELNKFKFNAVTNKHYKLIYNGAEYYQNADGLYQVDGKLYRAEITDGQLVSLTEGENAVDTAGYSVEEIPEVLTVRYNNETAQQKSGYYYINGDPYDVQMDANGNITGATKKGVTLSTAEKNQFYLGFGGNTLYYNDPDSGTTYSATKDENGNYTFGAPLNKT